MESEVKTISINTDATKTDISYVHGYLSNRSYWAEDRSFDIVKKSIENSICFNVMKGNLQMGFARVISDKATFAYIADVFIDEDYRGHGYAKKLVKHIMKHPDLQTITRWLLMTKDAHGLYEQSGFKLTQKSEWIMEYSPDK